MRIRYLVLATLVLLTSGAAAPCALAQGATDAPSEADIATAPVQFDGSTLFRVRGVSSLAPEARARAIVDRLTTVAADPAYRVESLALVEQDGATRIVAGEFPIMAVVDADASLEQIGRSNLAAAHLARLRQAIIDYRRNRSPEALRRGGFLALVATLLLVAAAFGLRWLWPRMDLVLTRPLQARMHALEIRSFEVMRAEQLQDALRSALLAVRVVVFLAIVLTYLGYVLGQFPWTHGLSQNMAAFALAPVRAIATAILASIPNLTFLTVLFFVFRLILRFVRLFFDGVARGTVTLSGFDALWAQPTYRLVRVGIVAFGLIVAYPYIPGSGSEAFKGVSLFIGILFSLGSSSAIGNIIAGYMMTYRRAFKVGDRIRIGDAIGDVIETRLQVTHLRSFKNEEIIIPNSRILGGDVVNYSSLSRTGGLILHTEVGIGYETPWRQVEAMLLMAASRTPGLATDPPPFILQKALGDFAVTYELNVYCADAHAMNALYTQLHRSILDVFNEFGVQIMTPAYEDDPPVPKVVARNDWYAAPAVRTDAPDRAAKASVPSAHPVGEPS